MSSRQSVGPIEEHDWECAMSFQSLGNSESFVVAVCSCGWQGEKRQLLKLAECDGMAHALEFAPVSTGPFG